MHGLERHAFKLGNMTVDLMNYHPDRREHVAKNWYVVSFFGTGVGSKKKVFSGDEIKQIEDILESEFAKFKDFKRQIKTVAKRVDSSSLQHVFENDLNLQKKDNPIIILKHLEKLIFQFDGIAKNKIGNCNLLPKNNIPIAHLMSAYGLLTLLK